jgi:nucleoside-diphosphate-sugar epimerase
MNQVVLTGGTGKLGRACLTELLEHDYPVTNVDLVRPAGDPCPFVRADLTDMGQTMEVLRQVDDRHRGVDAVVHLAAIPAPGWAPGSELFRNNTISTYNVFASAAQAVCKALEAPLTGAEVFIIASPDTVMSRPVTELAAEFFPGVPWRRDIGPHEALLDSGKARRVLGYEPQYSWRSEMAAADRGE